MKYSFVYTDGTQTLFASGTAQAYRQADAAIAALQSGEVPLVVGALPFHTSADAVLFSPRQHWFMHGWTPLAAAVPLGNLVSLTESPSPTEHGERVEAATARIRAGEFHKVVLSRSIECHFDQPVNARTLLNNYIAGSATGHGYGLDLGNADPRRAGEVFVGASPESLLSKRGAHLYTHPLAGTVARSTDPVLDQALATELLLSEKNRAEHAFVTADIRRVLEPLCTHLDIPSTPTLTCTSHTWHLGTPITAQLKDPAMSALEVAQLLHPTPAVSGFPQGAAQAYLQEQEPDRDLYTGAVGWADAHGNGDFRVAIRSALIKGDRVIARTGGGIVAESTAAEEVQETITKFGPVLSALGIDKPEGTVQ